MIGAPEPEPPRRTSDPGLSTERRCVVAVVIFLTRRSVFQSLTEQIEHFLRLAFGQQTQHALGVRTRLDGGARGFGALCLFERPSDRKAATVRSLGKQRHRRAFLRPHTQLSRLRRLRCPGDGRASAAVHSNKKTVVYYELPRPAAARVSASGNVARCPLRTAASGGGRMSVGDGAEWIGIGGARLSLVCFVPHNWPRRRIGATRKPVGVAGFEPARTRCSTRLRYRDFAGRAS